PPPAGDAHPPPPLPGEMGARVMILDRYRQTSRAGRARAGKRLGAHQPDLPPMGPVQPGGTRVGTPEAPPHPRPMVPRQDLRRGPPAGRSRHQDALCFAPELRAIVPGGPDLPAPPPPR